jgi:lipopolysaccharide biosynthesis glycosyltransferase
MEDYYLGAAVCPSQLFDLEQSQVGGQTWLEYKTDRLGFVNEKFLRYFNSGVMLMNLEKLREDEIREELESLFGEEFLALDQDMLNLVGRDRSVRYFEPEWNVFPYPADRYAFGRQRFPEFYEGVMAGLANPKLVHFLHTEKPLNRRVLYDHYYWYYSRMTPYHERGVDQYEANQRRVLRRNLLGPETTRALAFYEKWYTRLQRGRDQIPGLPTR